MAGMCARLEEIVVRVMHRKRIHDATNVWMDSSLSWKATQLGTRMISHGLGVGRSMECGQHAVLDHDRDATIH